MKFFPQVNRHAVLIVLMLVVIATSFLKIVFAATPNPGHAYTSVGGGTVQGDILYSSAADTLAVLPKSATTTQYLTNTGASNNPAWGFVNLANGVIGNLATTSLNGGTGASSTTFWRGDGTWANPLYKNIVTVPSDVVSVGAANALNTCTGLSFFATAGVRYRFHAHIHYTSNVTTNGSRWTLTGPAAPTQLSYTSEYALTATARTFNNAVAYSIPAGSSASSANTAGNVAIIDGTILPSANGTVSVQFASELVSPANNITCKAGSTIEWW